MSNSLQLSVLGNIEIVEIYEYYDEPCLFACKNGSGQIFLAVWIEQTKTDKTWLYAPVSLERFKLIRAGDIDLKNAFLNSEDGFVHKVIIPFDNSPARVEQVRCKTLNDEQLPESGEIIEVENESFFALETSDINQLASEKKREIINFTFKFPTVQSTEAPSLHLGKILSSFQPFVDAIGQVKSMGEISRIISSQILKQTEMSVTGTSSGSFVATLGSSPSSQKDLFDNTLAGDAIEEFLRLLKIGRNREELHGRLLALKSKSASKYRDFLHSIVDAGTGIHVNWGSPTPGRGGSAELSFSLAKEVLEIINQIELENQNEYEVIGELIAIHKRNKKFEIQEIQSKTKYKGEIIEEAMPDAGTATISQIYIATIREITNFTPVTGEEKRAYQLISIRPWEEQELPPNLPINNLPSSTQLDIYNF